MKFRGDIEGLRAIAIILVVAAHAGVPMLSSGFIGVDIFFVLSGFLITGVLYSEYERTERIALMAFYARRFRRLLPALVVMVLVTGVAGYLLLPPSSNSAITETGVAAVLWLSNIHFAFQKIDYFAFDEIENIFLHTWSLGVEEQFYLVWPVLTLLLLGFKSPLVQHRLDRLLLGFALVFVSSAIACLVISYREPLLAYYLMPTRAWQLASGGLLFLVIKRGALHPSPSPARWPAVAGLLGLSGLALSLALIDTETVYPGWWAFVPTLSTVLLLWAGSAAHAGPLAAWLASRPMQHLGAISYSWYLWHWPILVIGTQGLGLTSAVERLALVALSLVFAQLSTWAIEAPTRRMAFWTHQPRPAVLSSVLVMIIATSALWRVGAEMTREDDSDPNLLALASAASDLPKIYFQGCDEFYHTDRLTPCMFDPEDITDAPVVLVVGDSIGLQWFPAFESTFVDRLGWRLIVLTKSACPMIETSFHYARIGRRYLECEVWRGNVLDYIDQIEPDLVLLGSGNNYPFGGEEVRTGLRHVLDRVTPSTASTVVLRSTPRLGSHPRDCIAPLNATQPGVSNSRHCQSPAEGPRDFEFFAAITTIAGDYPDVHVVDLNGLVCPAGVCTPYRDGRVVYRDNQHLTASFVATLSDEVHDALRPAIGERSPSTLPTSTPGIPAASIHTE